MRTTILQYTYPKRFLCSSCREPRHSRLYVRVHDDGKETIICNRCYTKGLGTGEIPQATRVIDGGN